MELEKQIVIGHVLDINQGGLSIYTRKKLSVEQLVEIRLNRVRLNKNNQYIDLLVSTRWCKKNVQLNKYDAGFRIDAIIDIKSKMRIKELITDLSHSNLREKL